jgi:hypothetical protein
MTQRHHLVGRAFGAFMCTAARVSEWNAVVAVLTNQKRSLEQLRQARCTAEKCLRHCYDSPGTATHWPDIEPEASWQNTK